MPRVLNRRVVSDALRDRLVARIAWMNGAEVGKRTLAPPCIVVHPLQGGTVLDLLDIVEGAKQGSLPYQLTCVGVAGKSGRDQAEDLAAASIDALVGFESEVIARVGVDAWGNVRPDRDADPPVWISVPMVRVTARAEE